MVEIAAQICRKNPHNDSCHEHLSTLESLWKDTVDQMISSIDSAIDKSAFLDTIGRQALIR